METIVLIAAIILMTAIGMRLLLLNARHEARIAAHHFSDALPGVGRHGRRHHRRAHTEAGR
ncbi:hypothetical protein [Streptomyces sp. HUAS TT3]|uniref:hypothetical protein n=1 Tax=Streptomyces sp. HUAS TT3 TaxID=3447510 RepID=UPI003F65E76F